MKKRERKEKISRIISIAETLKKCDSKDENILPPSKVFIGKRFIIPRQSEDSMNMSQILFDVPDVLHMIAVISAHMRLARGPADDIASSLE